MAFAETRSRREGGAALMIAVVMLTIMGLLGLGSMELATRDRQSAGFLTRARTALYAADAGVAWGRAVLSEQVALLVPQGVAALADFNPAFPSEASPQILGDGSAPNPRFMQSTKPGIAQAIDYIRMGAECEDWIMSSEYGGSQWRESIFSINVEGRTAGTNQSTQRVEASAAYCYPYF